jgi:hypothetical protein
MGNTQCVKCGVPLDYYKGHKAIGNSCRIHEWPNNTGRKDEKCERCTTPKSNPRGNCFHKFKWVLWPNTI